MRAARGHSVRFMVTFVLWCLGIWLALELLGLTLGLLRVVIEKAIDARDAWLLRRRGQHFRYQVPGH